MLALGLPLNASHKYPRFKKPVEPALPVPAWVRLNPKNINRKLNDVIGSIDKCKDLKSRFDREDALYHDASDARETALMQWNNDHPTQSEAQIEREDVQDHAIFARFHEIEAKRELDRKSLLACLKPEIDGHRISRWRIFAEPSEKSKKVGEIEVSLELKDVHYARLSFFFLPARGPKRKFTPDMAASCEYDGLYHTVLARKGDWLEFPEKPFRKSVWVKFDGDWGPVETVKMKDLEIISLTVDGKKGSYVFKSLRVDKAVFKPYAPEDEEHQDADREDVEIPLKNLYDAHHHLLPQKIFVDGC